jgi:exodeoxyribonuclease VII large subunit
MGNILNQRTSKAPAALTVSQLTFQLRSTLEERFAKVSVIGEISNWGDAASGHCYFSIKDEGALLCCVMWRSARMQLRWDPREGDKVECHGRISVFDKRGQYQLNVERMTRHGEGDLWQRFTELKAKLEKEGLFAPERKRPLPVYPRTIGVVTSPTGAAIRDILSVLERRAPSASVLIYPARVQGAGAAREIAEGVRALGRPGRVDVLIVGRGGGSLEDLWEFNDEGLAREIHRCPVPVVSAVGHEVDFSISDFVSDLRAPTPSAAAEIVSAGYVDLREHIAGCVDMCRRITEGQLREMQHRVVGLVNSHALRTPELRLREHQQRVDLALRRLPDIIDRRLEKTRLSVQRLTGSLEGHNPELILQKGYAIVRRGKDGKVLQSADTLKKNLLVDLQLRDGSRRAVVTDDQADDLFS